MVTTACVAYWKYSDIEDITKKLFDHFGDSFYLEIQYHNTPKQVEISKRSLAMAQKYGIKMIVGLDSHYIYPEDSVNRDYILESKKMRYEDEDGWFMDYPNDETVIDRFLKQGVFTKEQIVESMKNTDILLTFDDYADNNPIFSHDIKLPTLYDGLSQKEKDHKYGVLVSSLFKKYVKDNNIVGEEYLRYFDGVRTEVQTVKDTRMADYFLIDYEIVKDAMLNGGVLTGTGRGSSVGYFTNTLLGFSKVDRFQSPITLYPERFISKTRILETHSLPDIDMNWGTPEIAENSQKRILGEEHAIPLIAFGTCKKKSAFKLYARAKNMDFDLSNNISSQIDKYEEALKNVGDDEKDTVDIYDYVDKKYEEYIKQSEEYWGIIMDKKKAPCAFLLYSGNIREEIGTIKCKSESTGKEFITAVIDGAIAENYKFLKNDILTVSVVLLIDKIYKEIGIKQHTVEQLKRIVKDDKQTWDLYANGFTLGVNQCEQPGSIKKIMRFKPTNVSELAAWIAAIRPAFKSMYSKFENREHFEYGIKTFDKLLQSEELPQSFILYQEQTMSVLNYAGFPLDECYGIIKAIAKKHPEKVKPLKSRFLNGFKNKVIYDENIEPKSAEQMSEQVWEIIENNCGYGFNSAHAYCMALDSLYCAYLKAHHPYEFYKVLLQFHSDRGEKAKVTALKQEMKIAFDISEGPYKYGEDNRRFWIDKNNKRIYPALRSLKGFNDECAESLYSIFLNERPKTFIEFLKVKENYKGIDKSRLDALIKIGYFDYFGDIGYLLDLVRCYDEFNGKKQYKKDQMKYPQEVVEIIKNYSDETPKQYRCSDPDAVLREVSSLVKGHKIPLQSRIEWENEYLGYVSFMMPEQKGIWVVTAIDTKYSPRLNIYELSTGRSETVKISKRDYQENPLVIGDTVRLTIVEKPKMKKVGDEWVQSETEKDKWLKYYTICNIVE